jgi:hypothetical protein
MPKGNEDLKAKIAKMQQKGKAQAPEPPMPEPEEEQDMDALEKEFEAKKQALTQKAKAKASPAPAPAPEAEGEADDAGIEQAIAEYSDDAKFRVEVVFQLVQLNKSMKDIADALKGLTNNDE